MSKNDPTSISTLSALLTLPKNNVMLMMLCLTCVGISQVISFYFFPLENMIPTSDISLSNVNKEHYQFIRIFINWFWNSYLLFPPLAAKK